jgi:phosphate-selective porin OprO and OprP
MLTYLRPAPCRALALLGLALAVYLPGPVVAAPAPPAAPPPEKAAPEKEKKEGDKFDGLFPLHLDKKDLFKDALVLFHQVGDQVQIRERNTNFRAPEGSALERSIRRSFADPVLPGFEVAATHPESKTLLIKLNGFSLTDVAATNNQGEGTGQNSGGATVDVNKPVEAGDDDAMVPRRKFVKWNEYDGPITTLRIGMGLLLDFSAYAQDEASKKQFSLSPRTGVRDFRFFLKGRFKTQRPLTWFLGYMYDRTDQAWRFRQTGIDIGFPELYGHLFIGRTKEGYSMVKVMTGYFPWGMERSETMDAFVPILADGVKWMGYFPRPRIYFSLGWFGDQVGENEKFATYDHQVVSRVTWLPIYSEPDNKLLHVGVMGRDGKPDGGFLQVRSRPEDYLAPYFLDTGKFAATHARTTGFEAYYRKGPLLFGGEYNWQHVDAKDGQHPTFQGGNVVAVWLITGETRGYNLQGAFFEPVSPKRSVFEGGPGAWEAVLNLSYTDFDSGSFRGGKFVRLTPMVNWHMSDNFRLELVYGYGMLDRFDLKGHNHFFQMRIQMVL